MIDCSVLFLRRELEQRLRELKRRKKDKKIAKLKEIEEVHEKDKKRWTDFNSKVICITNYFHFNHSLFFL